jgi:hypothetical protein
MIEATGEAYIGPGFKWRAVRKVRHIASVNYVGIRPGEKHRIRRKKALNNARLDVRVKSLKSLRYNVREVFFELVASDELAISNFPKPLTFKRMQDAIRAGYLLTRGHDVDAARSEVETLRQKREAA